MIVKKVIIITWVSTTILSLYATQRRVLELEELLIRTNVLHHIILFIIIVRSKINWICYIYTAARSNWGNLWQSDVRTLSLISDDSRFFFFLEKKSKPTVMNNSASFSEFRQRSAITSFFRATRPPTEIKNFPNPKLTVRMQLLENPKQASYAIICWLLRRTALSLEIAIGLRFAIELRLTTFTVTKLWYDSFENEKRLNDMVCLSQLCTFP